MMYLTAHRIHRRRDNRSGINTFLYEHEENALPKDMGSEKTIIDRITNQNPGTLIAESVDLFPSGGNPIRSYIDIIGRDDLDKEAIQRFLDDDVEPCIHGCDAPITRLSSNLAARFGISFGLEGSELQEYKALAQRALCLFVSRPPPKWRCETPWIEIIWATSDQQSEFTLSPRTARRLKKTSDEGLWPCRRISVDHNTKTVVESMFGDLIGHIAPVLTGLTLEEITACGGVLLRDPSTSTSFRWPQDARQSSGS